MELQTNRCKTKKCLTIKNQHFVKSTRKVRLGWKHKVGDKYKVMNVNDGGGSHILDLEKSDMLAEARQQAVDTFFPKGNSKKYKLSDVNYHIATFANEKVLDDTSRTVGQYFDSIKSHPVRWYLHTELKVSVVMLISNMFFFQRLGLQNVTPILIYMYVQC